MCKLYNSLCIYVATISLLSILLGSSSFDWPGAVSASFWCLTPCEGCIYLFVLARANVRGVFYGVFWHCHNYSRCGRESQPTKKTFHIHIHMHIYGSTITSSCLFLVGRTLHEACASPVELSALFVWRARNVSRWTIEWVHLSWQFSNLLIPTAVGSSSDFSNSMNTCCIQVSRWDF